MRCDKTRFQQEHWQNQHTLQTGSQHVCQCLCVSNNLRCCMWWCRCMPIHVAVNWFCQLQIDERAIGWFWLRQTSVYSLDIQLRKLPTPSWPQEWSRVSGYPQTSQWHQCFTDLCLWLWSNDSNTDKNVKHLGTHLPCLLPPCNILHLQSTTDVNPVRLAAFTFYFAESLGMQKSCVYVGDQSFFFSPPFF